MQHFELPQPLFTPSPVRKRHFTCRRVDDFAAVSLKGDRPSIKLRWSDYLRPDNHLATINTSVLADWSSPNAASILVLSLRTLVWSSSSAERWTSPHESRGDGVDDEWEPNRKVSQWLRGILWIYRFIFHLSIDSVEYLHHLELPAGGEITHSLSIVYQTDSHVDTNPSKLLSSRFYHHCPPPFANNLQNWMFMNMNLLGENAIILMSISVIVTS